MVLCHILFTLFVLCHICTSTVTTQINKKSHADDTLAQTINNHSMSTGTAVIVFWVPFRFNGRCQIIALTVFARYTNEKDTPREQSGTMHTMRFCKHTTSTISSRNSQLYIMLLTLRTKYIESGLSVVNLCHCGSTSVSSVQGCDICYSETELVTCYVRKNAGF